MPLIGEQWFSIFNLWQFRRFGTQKIKETFDQCLLNLLVVDFRLSLRSSGAKSGLLHLLTRSIRCGMDALHFELEVVRIAGVLQCGFIADQALRVQVVEGLVKRLHTVLRSAE